MLCERLGTRQSDAHGAAGYQNGLVREVPDHDDEDSIVARSFCVTVRCSRSTSSSMLVSLESSVRGTLILSSRIEQETTSTTSRLLMPNSFMDFVESI